MKDVQESVLETSLLQEEKRKEFDQQRISANKELLTILTGLIEDYPTLRFGQLLNVFDFIKNIRPTKEELEVSWQNEFYLEPTELVKRVKQRIKDLGDLK